MFFLCVTMVLSAQNVFKVVLTQEKDGCKNICYINLENGGEISLKLKYTAVYSVERIDSAAFNYEVELEEIAFAEGSSIKYNTDGFDITIDNNKNGIMKLKTKSPKQIFSFDYKVPDEGDAISEIKLTVNKL